MSNLVEEENKSLSYGFYIPFLDYVDAPAAGEKIVPALVVHWTEKNCWTPVTDIDEIDRENLRWTYKHTL